MSGRALSPSVSGAAVAGFIGGAITWALASSASALPSTIRGYGRLDQLMALLLGACVGACVLSLRARHRRERITVAALAGTLVGGVAAATGASIGLMLSGSASPVGFVLERAATWALMCAATSVALAMCTRTRHASVAAESTVIGAVGGVLAGAMISLPGPTELWWPLALTIAGAIIGFAAVGPGMWRAPVVVQLLPQREHRLTLWSLHECAIEHGWSMPIAEAQVGCIDGTAYVYPPPAGAVLDGYPLYRALPLTRDAILGVGRMRARIAVRSHTVRLWVIVAVLLGGVVPADVRAQTSDATWRLVRCHAMRAAACLATQVVLTPGSRLARPASGLLTWRATLTGVGMVGPEQRDVNGATQPALTPVFGAPVLPSTSLARTTVRGTLSLLAFDDSLAAPRTVIQLPVSWRPPLIAMPLFVGVADSASVPDAVRDALAAGDDPPGIRGVVALLLVGCAGLLVLFVPRFAWRDYRETEEDLARQVAAARALLSTQELEELRGKAPREAKPRAPDESTTESATLPRPRR